MVQADGGGGGGGNAGPLETKLIQSYAANLEAVRGAAASWVNGQVLLDGVARGLKTQAQLLETTFGKNNPTGMAAAERYREVQTKVEKRANEMKTAAQALQHTRDGLVAAQADYDGLPKVTTNPNAPQSDLEKLMDPGGQMRQAQYDGERQAREKAAGEALDRLDTHFEKSAKDLRTVAGDAPDRSGNGGGDGGGGGSSPLARSSGGGTTVATGGPSGSGGGFHHNQFLTGGHVDGPGEHGGNDDGPAWEGPNFDTNPTGTLSGPTTSPDYTGPGNGGGYGGSATPTSGSGAGVASALGAGVAGGAGAIAASRGGVPATRAVGAPGSSTGALGRSSSTARGGAIGRSGTTVPGQSTQARSGAAGRGGAGGRSGAAGGQTQRSGGKGGAGGRAGRAGGAAGSTQGRRGGKKDENDVTQEHLAFADEESWLDDEGANDSVID